MARSPFSSSLLLFLAAAMSAASMLGPDARGAEAASTTGTARSACFRACRTCQQMYGRHFEGHLCAHTCVRLRGRAVPDCADLASIAPFLDVNNSI